MPYSYDVQGCTITGSEIMRVYNLPGFASIIMNLFEEKGDLLALGLYAANSADQPLPDSHVSVDTHFTKHIVLNANTFIERRNIYITKAMIDEVLTGHIIGKPVHFEIKSMKFTPREFKYKGNQYPGDKHKEFIGFSVFIKRRKV